MKKLAVAAVAVAAFTASVLTAGTWSFGSAFYAVLIVAGLVIAGRPPAAEPGRPTINGERVVRVLGTVVLVGCAVYGLVTFQAHPDPGDTTPCGAALFALGRTPSPPVFQTSADNAGRAVTEPVRVHRSVPSPCAAEAARRLQNGGVVAAGTIVFMLLAFAILRAGDGAAIDATAATAPSAPATESSVTTP